MSRLFGTDGIRGIPGMAPLDGPTIRGVAQALSEVVAAPAGSRRVLLGRDTRLSGGWIEELLDTSLSEHGIETQRAGVVSTPAVSFLVREGKFTAGIMISASHNPAHYNGIKIFSADGTKLDDALEEQIEQRVVSLLARGQEKDHRQEPSLPPPLREQPDIVAPYIEHLVGTMSAGLEGMHVVMDCAHGSNWHIAPELLTRLGAEVGLVGASPDGRNINDRCGALHPEFISQIVHEAGADAGICFDGDGDRTILCDESGQVIDGDHMLYLFARYLGACGGERKIVGTVMSNVGLEAALRRLGFQLLRAPVGDRFVHEWMIREGAWIGGEQSGHIILRHFANTGDGLLTALQVLGIMRRQGRKLSRLVDDFQKFPQVLINVPVRLKTPLEEVPTVCEAITRVEAQLGPESRILVRYSGTEPLARVMIEGRDQGLIAEAAQEIASAIQERLS